VTFSCVLYTLCNANLTLDQYATNSISTASACAQEVVCSHQTGSSITSGGGFSEQFRRPTYQDAVVAAYLRAHGVRDNQTRLNARPTRVLKATGRTLMAPLLPLGRASALCDVHLSSLHSARAILTIKNARSHTTCSPPTHTPAQVTTPVLPPGGPRASRQPPPYR
jgi:hypothetical protein